MSLCLGTVARPVYRSLLSRSEPQQGGWLPVCQLWWPNGYSAEPQQWPWEPVLPCRWQCCWHLWRLLWNPYLIHQAYPQEELPKNCSELRDQVELHDFTQVGVVHRSVCFELVVGKAEYQVRHRHGCLFSAAVFHLSQSKQQYSTTLLLFLIIKTCCS